MVLVTKLDTDLTVFRGTCDGELVPVTCNGDGPKDVSGCQPYYSRLELDISNVSESYYVAISGHGGTCGRAALGIHTAYWSPALPPVPPPTPPAPCPACGEG